MCDPLVEVHCLPKGLGFGYSASVFIPQHLGKRVFCPIWQMQLREAKSCLQSTSKSVPEVGTEAQTYQPRVVTGKHPPRDSGDSRGKGVSPPAWEPRQTMGMGRRVWSTADPPSQQGEQLRTHPPCPGAGGGDVGDIFFINERHQS